MGEKDIVDIVLFPVYDKSHFREMIKLGSLLARSSSYSPKILFIRYYPLQEMDISECERRSIKYKINYNLEAVRESASPRRSLLKRPIKISCRKIWGHLSGKLSDIVRKSFLWKLIFLIRKIQKIKKVIRELKPTAIVLPAEHIDQLSTIFVKAGHYYNVPSAVFPSWMAGPDEAAGHLKNSDLYHLNRWSNKLAGWFYPNWVHHHQGQALIRKPASAVLAMECLGLAPPNPWVLHSGQADVICVESQAMADYGISLGLEPERIKVTGSPAHDILARGMEQIDDQRDGLLAELGLPSGRRIILTALPPDFFHARQAECEFESYDSLVESWVASLAELTEVNVIINLHPSMTYDRFCYLERNNVRISSRGIDALIPLCDLFVASISATIQWAIACAKPVLNYDVYGYRYPDYVGVPGVLLAENKKEYANLLERLTGDQEFMARVAQAQAEVAEYWGILDGQSGRRIRGLLGHLVGAGGQPGGGTGLR